MFKVEEIEQFDLPSSVFFKLLPKEKLAYKLKVRYMTLSNLILILFCIFLPIIIIIIVIYSYELEIFGKFFLLYPPLFVLFVFIPIDFINLYQTPKKIEFFIYISNLNIFLITRKFSFPSPDYKINVVDLPSILAIDIQHTNSKKNVGKIEFTSRRFKEYKKIKNAHSIVSPPVKNASEIAKIIESLIWYNGEVNRRLEQKIKKSRIYTTLYKNNSIETHENYLCFMRKGIKQKIKFSEIISLSYESNSLKIILTNGNFPNTIYLNLGKEILDYLEIVYLQFLSWKYKTNNLMKIEDLLRLTNQQNQFIFEKRKRVSNSTTMASKHSQELIIPFLNEIDKDETIQLFFSPNKLKSGLIISILISVCIVYLYFITISYLDLTTFLIFLLFFSPVILILITFLFRKSTVYIFTSKKLITGNIKKINAIPYENIIAINCINKLFNQLIQVHLKYPNQNDNRVVWIYSPKKDNLYGKIISLSYFRGNFE